MISRVPNQNGVSLLHITLEIHHSSREPSIYSGDIPYWLETLELCHVIINHCNITQRLDKGKILERWAEHCDSILNHPSIINDEAIHRLPQVPLDETLDAVPSFEKIGSDSSAKQHQSARCRLNPC